MTFSILKRVLQRLCALVGHGQIVRMSVGDNWLEACVRCKARTDLYESPVLEAVTVTLFARDKDAFPELAANNERIARDQLRRKGIEPIAEAWHFEDEYETVDPETGEDFMVPARWIFTVEGVRP